MPQRQRDQAGRIDAVLKSFDVLGVPVMAVTWEDVFNVIADHIRNRQPGYVCVRDVHGIILSQNDPNLVDIHRRAALVVPDGMPIVWIGRLQGHKVERICGPDLLPALCRISVEKGYRNLFYGGGKGTAARLQHNLQAAYPGLVVVGAVTPPFRPLSDVEEAELVKLINKWRPDIMWVGLSTPKQEKFMAKYSSYLNVPVMVGVGAAFDIHAGLVKRAPRWLQRTGLEWMWRVMQEPKRNAWRYGYCVPRFMWLFLRQSVANVFRRNR
jgi:N-acetylglucosaminyldiphosphoundecaprenol N-acetyl-beta-D-mannosaminyltransferase